MTEGNIRKKVLQHTDEESDGCDVQTMCTTKTYDEVTNETYTEKSVHLNFILLLPLKRQIQHF